MILQFDQLRFAETSPRSAAMEEEKRLVFSIRLVSDWVAVLVGKGEYWNLRSNFWTLRKFFAAGITCVWQFLGH
jgi:hypothetical protein